MLSIVEPKRLPLFLPALIGLAWLALLAWGQSDYSRFLNHLDIGPFSLNGLGLLLVFQAGWILLVIAMLLPANLPFIGQFYALTRLRWPGGQMLYLLLVGFVAVWAMFGLTVRTGDWWLHEQVRHDHWWHSHDWVIKVGVVLAAGLYQLSPLKTYFLEKHRGYRDFRPEEWRKKNYRQEALGLGWRSGLVSLGSGWALLLLMFGVGMGNLAWMLGLGLVIAAENNLPWGRELSKLLGMALLGWGFGLGYTSLQYW